MVEFLFLFGLEIFFELFVLVLEGFDGVRIFGVDFIVELDNVLVEVLLDFLLGFEFEGGKLLEVDFDGFEGGLLVEEVEEVLFLLVEVGYLSFEFDQFLLVRGEVVFDIIDEGQLGF